MRTTLSILLFAGIICFGRWQTTYARVPEAPPAPRMRKNFKTRGRCQFAADHGNRSGGRKVAGVFGAGRSPGRLGLGRI